MTDPRLSEAALAAIGEQAEKATPGPWQVKITLQALNDLGRATAPNSVFESGRSIHTAWDHGQLHGPAPVVTIASTPFAEPGRIVYISPEDAAFIAAARSAVPALLDHIAWQGERLAEAEQESERGIITDDKSIEAAFLEYWGERSDDKPNRMAAHRAYCYRAYQEAKTITALRAQLARERADHAATVAELEDTRKLLRGKSAVIDRFEETIEQQQGESTKLWADLTTEKAARLAAEGQVAELRNALEKVSARTGGGCYDCMISEGEVCERCREIRSTVEIALAATPSKGAAAVLAAAEAETLAEGESDAYRSGPRFLNSDRKQEILGKLKTTAEARRGAVAAWRAAREGGKGG